MAVTTGTTWDIVLANEPVSTTDPIGSAAVSPRAAYQAALYDRAVIVDLRDERRRRVEGALPAELSSAVVGRRELTVWLRESLATRVLLLDDDGALARQGNPVAPQVAAVAGGFDGWRAAGLPTA
jgi:hypothetical protein